MSYKSLDCLNKWTICKEMTSAMIKSNETLTMMNSKNKSALWFALILYWLLIAVLLIASLINTGGHFGYPIDDTYIHMAIGKHLVRDRFWGVSQFGFSSSTSSPLWTFLIALTYMLFGVNDYSPFLLALIAGAGLVIYTHSLLSTFLSPFRSSIFLAAIIILTPLAMLALSGMEHLLHALFTIILLFNAIELLETKNAGWQKAAWVAVMAGLTTITRYEGLFLVFSICMLLLVQKRWIQSMLIGAAGLLPISAYGFFSISKGWLFFPNSILLKGNTLRLSPEGLTDFFQHLTDNILLASHIFILISACVGIYFWIKHRHSLSEKDKYLVILFTVTGYLHMQFASVGWFYRHDAYLVPSGLLVIAQIVGPVLENVRPTIQGNLFKNAVYLLIGIFLSMPLVIRAESAHAQYPIAVKNIHDQQYQMGLFMRKYYSGTVIAANDIGEINYLADVNTLDLYGLANLDVAKARQNETYDAGKVRDLALKNKVEIVVIYDSWFKENRPPEWIEIGQWQIANNVACADDLVTFYVTEAAFKSDAISNLQDFSTSLPADVQQFGAYTSR